MDLSRIKFNKATLNIILWNLTPYFGVYFLDWQPLSIFVCYALETIVIGIFNVFKLVAVYYYGVRAEQGDMGLFSVVAFSSSYSLLVYVQLTCFFVVAGNLNGVKGGFGILEGIDFFMDDETTYIALSAFVVSNAFSFVNDFILSEEYTRRNVNQQIAEPFPRVLIMQAIVFGGLIIFISLGNGMGIIIPLTILKIISEIILKNRKATEIIVW